MHVKYVLHAQEVAYNKVTQRSLVFGICKCPYKYLPKDSVHFEKGSKTISGSYVNMSSKNEASIYLWKHFPYLDGQTFDHF